MLTTIIDEVKENIAYIYDKNEINHIVNVYRMKIGDKIRAIDYTKEYILKIKDISKKMIILDILDSKLDSYSYDFCLDVAIGILKNDKMNLVIQKLTELGVNSIIPLNTKRVVVKINDKKEKWELVIKESLKQCKGIKKLILENINTIESLNYEKYDKIVYAYENSESSLKINKILNEKNKNILCIIGPEGGFEASEIEYLKSKNALEISLGKRILRAETAAIVLSGNIINSM